MQQLINVIGRHAPNSFFARDQLLAHHIHRDAGGGPTGTFAAARLQHPQFSVFDGEFDILHVVIMHFEAMSDIEQLAPGDRITMHWGVPCERITPEQEATILAATEQPPPGLLTHWSSRRLARRLGVSHVTVMRVWHKVGLQPHRLRRYMASPDPAFEAKTKDILGLYLRPPKNAAVFCVDEKTAIQALDRTQPALPLQPRRPERQAVEYVRHGMVSLFAALEVHS